MGFFDSLIGNFLPKDGNVDANLLSQFSPMIEQMIVTKMQADADAKGVRTCYVVGLSDDKKTVIVSTYAISPEDNTSLTHLITQTLQSLLSNAINNAGNTEQNNIEQPAVTTEPAGNEEPGEGFADSTGG